MSLDDPSAVGDPAETESAGAVAPTDAPGVAGSTEATDATGSLPQLFADRYSLGARRGSSVDLAMFDAVDTADQRAVVLKIVHPDIVASEGFVDRFTTTMEAVAVVRHPNLSEVYDFGVAEWNGRTVCFVVGESLTGGSLRDLRDRGRELSLSQAVVDRLMTGHKDSNLKPAPELERVRLLTVRNDLASALRSAAGSRLWPATGTT
jgi:hypothetical protein